MHETYEKQADTFMETVAKEQDKLLAYARSLTKDHDTAHDLFADALLKCRERIALHGFHGEGYLAYLITSIKFNHYYAKRSTFRPNPFEVMAAQEQDLEGTEARLALAAGVRSFIVAHFSTQEVEILELHLQGVTLREIVFLSDYRNKDHVDRAIQKIKKEVREAFR